MYVTENVKSWEDIAFEAVAVAHRCNDTAEKVDRLNHKLINVAIPVAAGFGFLAGFLIAAVLFS